MSTYPPGCQIIIRDPKNPLDERCAQVVEQATRGVDQFVRVKYPGKVGEFQVRWKDIKPIGNLKPVAVANPVTAPETIVILSDDESPPKSPSPEAHQPDIQTRPLPSLQQQQYNPPAAEKGAPASPTQYRSNVRTVRDNQAIPHQEHSKLDPIGQTQVEHRSFDPPATNETYPATQTNGQPFANDYHHGPTFNGFYPQDPYASHPARGGYQGNYGCRREEQRPNDFSGTITFNNDLNEGSMQPQRRCFPDHHHRRYSSDFPIDSQHVHQDSFYNHEQFNKSTYDRQQYHYQRAQKNPSARPPPQQPYGARTVSGWQHRRESFEPNGFSQPPPGGTQPVNNYSGPHSTAPAKRTATSTDAVFGFQRPTNLRSVQTNVTARDELHRAQSRHQAGDVRPFFRNESQRLVDQMMKLPDRHSNSSVLGIPIPRTKRRRVEDNLWKERPHANINVDRSVSHKTPSILRPLTPPPSLSPLPQPCGPGPSHVKFTRAAHDVEESVCPPVPDMGTHTYRMSEIHSNDTPKRWSAEALPDIAPSFKTQNPITSNVDNTVDETLTQVLEEIIMDAETLDLLETSKARREKVKLELFPTRHRRKSKPVKRNVRGRARSVNLLDPNKVVDKSEISIADFATMLDGTTASKHRVYSCLCGLLEEPQVHGQSGSIQCGMCGLWSHLRCTQLIKEELEQFQSGRRRFLCWSCVDCVVPSAPQSVIEQPNSIKWGIQMRPVLPIRSRHGKETTFSKSTARHGRCFVRAALTEDERAAREDNVEALREGLARWSIGEKERNLVDGVIGRESIAPLLS